MKIEPNGKWQWNGIARRDDGEDYPFAVFADDFKSAVASIDADMPGEVIVLERGVDVSELSFELPQHVADKIQGATKKSLN